MRLVFLASLFLLFVCASAQPQHEAIVVTLNVPNTQVVAGAAFPVQFSFTNQMNHDLAIVRYGTFMDSDPILGDFLFARSFQGRHAQYIGPVGKRVWPPTEEAESFFHVAAGQTVEVEVDISQYYEFNADDMHHLQFKQQWLVQVPGSEELFPITAFGLPAAVHVRGAADARRRRRSLEEEAVQVEEEPQPLSQSITFIDCSSTRKNTVNNAAPKALSTAASCVSCLNSDSCPNDYSEWFGSETSSRYSKIQSDYSAIDNALNSGFKINCGTCTSPGTYAYVYPTDTSHTIYLCPVFWNAPSSPSSYDSQPGTLIHEMSHFNNVAGTDDIIYGTSGCKNLAKNNPNQAINNADSHEYFAESPKD